MAHDTARIAEWLQPQHILLDIDARDGVHVLEIAAATIAQAQQLNPAPIFSALWRREQARSTGLGDGFAIPHARISDIATPITLFMRTKVGIEFHAPDGKPVSQLLVIMVPADGAKQDHLDLLALVAQLFSSHEFRKRLTSAADTKAAAEVFRIGVAEIT
jgi:PTS system nitrogen regulatory IIA component